MNEDTDHIFIESRSKLNAHLRSEWKKTSHRDKHNNLSSFRKWFEDTYECNLFVAELIAGFPSKYRIDFPTPKQQLLFRLKYSEFLND